MKETGYNNIICRHFCSFYKDGKDNMACRGYKLLKDQLTLSELHSLAGLISGYEGISKQIPPENELLSNLLCKQCDFLIDGCDFADNRSGPPCGGYILIRLLLSISAGDGPDSMPACDKP